MNQLLMIVSGVGGIVTAGFLVHWVFDGDFPNVIYKAIDDYRNEKLKYKVQRSFDCLGGKLVHPTEIADHKYNIQRLEKRIAELEHRGSI